jgi:hypothetical protein
MFRRFAAGARQDGATRYAQICDGAASDEDLLGLVAHAPPDQRRPNILLAAVHFLLLTGADDPLAAWYPTVLLWRGMDPGTARTAESSELFPAFASFCRHHRDALSELVATRATQTNEVGRCTAIFPALSTVASRVDAPLAIVDVGASAGLNLHFDRYAYAYDDCDSDGTERLAGDSESPVVLRCDVREGRNPTALPTVAARVGLDRRPVDVRDDDQARWLLSCQWPDHVDRFEISRAAIALARTVPDPPLILKGGAVEDLASVVATLPDDAHVCVLHSWVAAYLTPDAQRALAEVISGLARVRPLSWVFAEAPYEVPGLPVPPPRSASGEPAEERHRAATAVVLVEESPGVERVARRLADMQPHGRWLYWYGAQR